MAYFTKLKNESMESGIVCSGVVGVSVCFELIKLFVKNVQF